MSYRTLVAAAMLSMAAVVAPIALAAPAPALALAAGTTMPVKAPVNYLELAYHSAWTAIKSGYADAGKLAQLADWQNKFDGKLHTQQDLDHALEALITYVGNGQIRLLSPSQAAAVQAARLDQQLGWGLQAQLAPANAGQRQSLTITASSYGPAQQAGVLTDDVVESLNNVPADWLTADQVALLHGTCQLGETLRIKLTRRTQPITVACGPAPVDEQASFSVASYNFPSGHSSASVSLVRIKPTNLDDSRLQDRIQQALTGPDGNNRAVLFDLRGTSGSDYARIASIAALFLQQGMLGCEAPRQDHQLVGVCHAVDNQKATRFAYGTKPTLLNFKSHDEPIVVLLDGTTSGTALTLAAALRGIGAKVITTGPKSRGFDDEPAYQRLLGDPSSRTIAFPAFHITQPQPPNDARTFDADDVEATVAAAYGKAGEFFGTKDPLTESLFGTH